MKTRKLIIASVLILTIGIILFAQIDWNLSYYNSNCKQNIHSNWNSSESICSVANTKDTIAYRKADIIVKLNEKVIGDTSAINPFVIDLSNEGIVINEKLFFKSCKVNFIKKIHQEFNLNTDLTSIKTKCEGTIIYNIDYEIKGLCNYEKAEMMITNRIMNDIYMEAKKMIKLELPIILGNNIPKTPTENLPNITINKRSEL